MSPPSPRRSTRRRSTKTSRRGPALAPGDFVFGLGSNLGEREAVLLGALASLAAALGPLAVSSPYRSVALVAAGAGPQPDYLNAVAVGHADLDPEALVALAKATERRAGRRRAPRWAARVLDIDLLLWGSIQRGDLELTLPHPRMRKRAFVLAPLAELLPDLPLPPDGATPLALLRAHTDATPVARLDWSRPLPSSLTREVPCSSMPS
ncbi:MAG: 2-amino-4-hydroxy-6-hydroxymethyldihydropteridine diphosphokinase [Holophagales bacterium]|nr:MAG: 2-amino-4-hydroxy-6-hydroxymethyldihydropteridine diphosphokinase [Holophagales bacterium]